MPNRGDYLMSTLLPNVVSIRVSDDYLNWIANHKRLPTWRIGLNNLLAYSLGLLPTKDVFWSSENNPGYIHNHHPLPGGASEPNPGMTALIATLSAGQGTLF